MSKTLDRLPPHSNEAEMGVLGCCLLEPNQCISDCVERLGGDGKLVFYDLRHQTIYETLSEMFNQRLPIDLITIQQSLKDGQILEQIGGIPYLCELQEAVPSAANLGYYLEIVQEKHLLRRLIRACSDVVGKVYDFEGNADSLLESVEREILSLRRVESFKSKSISALMAEASHYIEERASNWDKIFGLSTGIQDLDRMTDGLHGGELIVIGAPTSCGKTAMSLQICLHNALNGNAAGFLSAEMTQLQLALRTIANEARVNVRRFSESDGPAAISAMAKISKSPLHIENINGKKIGEIQALVRRMVQKHKLKIVGIENIQIIEGAGDNREQRVASISNGLKAIAMEHNIPVIGLSQLNDDGKLRDSRAIGHDADSAWIISNDGAWQPKMQPVNLKIEKCREGETGSVKLMFIKENTRFEQIAKFEND